MGAVPFTFDQMYDEDEEPRSNVSSMIRRNISRSERQSLINLDDPENFMDVEEELE